MIINTKKGYLEVRFRWHNRRRHFSMGCICKMHLDMAQKYMNQIEQIRQQYKNTGESMPLDPPKPDKIPCLGKLIEKYESLAGMGDYAAAK